jgi:hypothetical protein
MSFAVAQCALKSEGRFHDRLYTIMAVLQRKEMRAGLHPLPNAFKV